MVAFLDSEKDKAKLIERIKQLEVDNKRLRESLEYIASCTSCWEEYVEQALKGN